MFELGVSRRRFLRALAGSALLAQLPSAARASDRPPIEFNFPQDPLLTWFEPTYGGVKSDGRRHLGIDLMAPKLSPVYSAADGFVTRIADSPRAGRYLMIQHSDEWQSWYMHLNNDAAGRDNGRADWALTIVNGLEEGDWVEAGSHVAFVGDSGNAEGVGSHTHFELHLGSRTVNPWPYLVTGQEAALARIEAEVASEVIERLCRPRTELGFDDEMCSDDFGYLKDQLEIPAGTV
jgi:murein DD-endopeptidase MepM/ murein hydrolase activator NlpD